MKLTDRVVNSLKPKSKLYKVVDGDCLVLVVKPSGYKVWRFEYKTNGKQKSLTIGPYPAIGLADARGKAQDARKRIVEGIDPASEKRRIAGNLPTGDESSFGEIAMMWFEKKQAGFSEGHAANVKSRMDRIIIPALGAMRIKEITPRHLYDLFRPIEARGAYETAHRVYQVIGNVFRYAIKLGKCERDITADMRGMLEPRTEKHHPTITDPIKVGKLLRAIDGYDGYFVVACALKLAPLTFVRPGELRGAEWREFNLESAEWRIPAERMKMKRPHIVPLAKQSLEILRELRKATGHCDYLFPSIRTTIRTISENTVNSALRQFGYTKEEFTGHGFRSMASTLLNQMGWNKDWIERQLAHEEGNSVRATYNFADFLPQRVIMMQAWADYLAILAANLSNAAPSLIPPSSRGL
jgi:integrase